MVDRWILILFTVIVVCVCVEQCVRHVCEYRARKAEAESPYINEPEDEEEPR